jgi:hypothetical protein
MLQASATGLPGAGKRVYVNRACLVAEGMVEQLEPKIPQKGLIDTFLSVESRDFSIKWVFDHFKGYAICGLLFWAALEALSKHEVVWNSMASVVLALGASALLAIALGLYVLNQIHGVVWFVRSPLKMGAKTFAAVYLLVMWAVPVMVFSRH